ncbi:hypothetical protein WDW89_02595 [Deltaproteobacteria bacterium TL4]
MNKDRIDVIFVVMLSLLTGCGSLNSRTEKASGRVSTHLYSEQFNVSTYQYNVELYEEHHEGEKLLHVRVLRDKELFQSVSQRVSDLNNFVFEIDEVYAPNTNGSTNGNTTTDLQNASTLDQVSHKLAEELAKNNAFQNTLLKVRFDINEFMNDPSWTEEKSKSTVFADFLNRNINPKVRVNDFVSNDAWKSKESDQSGFGDFISRKMRLNLNLEDFINNPSWTNMDKQNSPFGQYLEKRIKAGISKDTLAAVIREILQSLESKHLLDSDSLASSLADALMDQKQIANRLAVELIEKEKLATFQRRSTEESLKEIKTSNAEGNWAKSLLIIDQRLGDSSSHLSPKNKAQLLTMRGALALRLTMESWEMSQVTSESSAAVGGRDPKLDKLIRSLDTWMKDNNI